MSENQRLSLRQRRYMYARAIGAFFLILLFQNCGKPFETSQFGTNEALSLSPPEGSAPDQGTSPGDFCLISRGIGKRNADLVCVVESCNSQYHQEGQGCVSDQRSCSIQSGFGVQAWNGTGWGPCQVSQCPAGRHIESGNCVPSERSCSVTGGAGSQVWTGSGWTSCEVSSCVSGYRLEGNTCVAATENQVCLVNGVKGTQGFVSGVWNSCRTCTDAYTSFKGVCHENPTFVKKYGSLLPFCWNRGIVHCPVSSFSGFIGVPSRFGVTVGQTVSFPITFTGAKSVNLTASDVQLSGPGALGCQKTISGTGSERQVILSSCSGMGSLKISIAAGSATSATGQLLASFGPSPDVIVSNTSGLADPTILETTLSYTGSQGQLIPYEYNYPKDFATRRNIPIIIWIHGGSWMGGSAQEDRTWAQTLAELGFIVVNLNYTLAKANAGSYTVGPNDINAFMAYLKANVGVINGDLSKISIAGNSAGAHLALHQATRADNTTNFRCVISLSGPTDLTEIKTPTNYPLSKEIIDTVFGTNILNLQNNSPALNFSQFKGQKLALFHQVEDNLVPISQALHLVSTVKNVNPGLDMSVIYGVDPNPYWISPQASQLTHVFNVDSAAMIFNSLKGYVHTNCR